MIIDVRVGSAINLLRGIDDKSVNCCVTSPPYWGLRNYGIEGQLGLEKTPKEYVEKLVSVFRDVRRTLRDDGTLWLNLGDSYVAKPTGGLSTRPSKMTGGRATQKEGAKRPDKNGAGLKAKDLVGIPWMVAFALRADGWHLRSDIIWAKPNPMPESVLDRCTRSHEYIFMLSKSNQYYFDADAIKEPSVTHDKRRPYKSIGANNMDGRRDDCDFSKRNKRDVWTISSKPFKGAHFATFPPDLIEPCVLAGCPEGGVVLDPFTGSGTTGIVSISNQRQFVGIELNPKYAKMAIKRIAMDSPLLTHGG